MDRSNWLPKNERKTILFLGDDIRIPSGIGTMSREIVEGTCHIFNWVQLGAAIKHPEAGQIIDMSEEMQNRTGVKDASVIVYPNNGYGDPFTLRRLIKKHNPDALLHFTDPRYWVWLYEMENELRQSIPILFYTIWDDLPYPYYNENYYRSCDWLGCISKQTYNIVKQVRNRKEPLEDWQLSYVPHGINPDKFYKITPDNTEEWDKLQSFKKNFISECDDPFIFLYNSRNIKRKMTSDIILSFRDMFLRLSKEDQEKTFLILHTQPVEEAGTDLPVVIRDVAPETINNIKFSTAKLEQEGINALYNIADVVVNISSNEGFGLSVAEGLMTETPAIISVTGGLQDQAGFRDADGILLNPDVHFTYEWGSNHDGKYTDHGEWAFPVFPKTRTLVGSPITPYIFDDRVDWKDVADTMMSVRTMSKKDLDRRGKLGREFCLTDGGLNSENMCNLFIDNIHVVLEKFVPRGRFVMEKV